MPRPKSPVTRDQGGRTFSIRISEEQHLEYFRLGGPKAIRDFLDKSARKRAIERRKAIEKTN